MSWIGVGGAGVETWKTKSAAIVSGGSFVSTSWTAVAVTVTAQVSFATKFAVGSRVNVVGPPLTFAAWAPLTVHEMLNHGSTTVTGSLNVIVTLLSTGTPVAPS